jgi:transcriptional regulator of acetoin/glycerol metabolism
MPLALQTRLLRVLEERQVVPLGGATARPLDVRLISAGHQDLRACVAEGCFPEDLFYRIAGFAVQLPPLRERSEKGRLLDLLLREEAAGARVRLEAGVRERLLAQPWPGNVRQLRTCLRTLVELALEGYVALDDLAELLPAAPATAALAENPLGVSERQTLLTLIEAEHWHIAHVAARLGISRNTLYRNCVITVFHDPVECRMTSSFFLPLWTWTEAIEFEQERSLEATICSCTTRCQLRKTHMWPATL